MKPDISDLREKRQPADAARFCQVAGGAIAALLIFILFHFWGNRANPDMSSASIFGWIGMQWMLEGGDFSHGWIMPLISLYVVWTKRRQLAEVPKSVSYAGFAMFTACLVLHWAALRAQQPRVSLVAFTGVLWSIPWFLFGWRVAKLLLFPAGYLLLCFTSYLLMAFTMPMRLVSCAISSGLLNGLGIQTVRHGTAIYTGIAGGFNFDVADPCSGLRSIVVMTALAAPYAYFTQKTLLKRWLLFAMSIPLAIVANVARIVTIALAAKGFGREFAVTIYHDYSGFLVFGIAVLIMVWAGAVLDRLGSGRGAEQ